MILALKSRKLFDTIEAKKKKKIDIYIISVPRNKEISGIRSYQKMVLGSNFSDRY